MHVLILENNINIDNLVLKLQENPNIGLIFASQDAICNIEDVTTVDADSDEVAELLDFALANEIGFVFALSSKAQSSELKEIFEMNGINVFASSQFQFENLLSRCATKKMIYKNKIPIPKFAVFEKLNLALDWCKTANFPIIIKSDMKDERRQNFYVDTYLKAQEIIENLFEQGFEKIVAEQEKEGHCFTVYYLTDSISHVHIANFYKNKDLRVCPDFQISQKMQDDIFANFYLKVLDAINFDSEPFSGVLKLDFEVIDNELLLSDVTAKFKTTDFIVLLNALDVDIFDLLSSISTGVLEDYEGCMLLKDNYFAYVEKEEPQPLFDDDDNVECIELNTNKYMYLAEASTVNRACGYLDEIG